MLGMVAISKIKKNPAYGNMDLKNDKNPVKNNSCG
jgi:hypothetical protein